MSDVMLTTSDNPWNPYNNFDEWFTFDESKKYCTSGLMARYSSDLYGESEQEQEEDRVQAMQKVLELFPFGPIGIEDEPNKDPIVYELIEKNGNRTKQTNVKDCLKLLNRSN